MLSLENILLVLSNRNGIRIAIYILFINANDSIVLIVHFRFAQGRLLHDLIKLDSRSVPLIFRHMIVFRLVGFRIITSYRANLIFCFRSINGRILWRVSFGVLIGICYCKGLRFSTTLSANNVVIMEVSAVRVGIILLTRRRINSMWILLQGLN